VTAIDGWVFAHHTNPHSGCYAMTGPQLRRAIASGGFLVAPHEGRISMLEAAASDPFTQCGFRKVVAVSHLDRFLVRHLPDTYVGRLGTPERRFRAQIGALMEIAEGRRAAWTSFPGRTRLEFARWDKRLDEAPDPLLFDLIGDAPRSVLSVGCGTGRSEAELARRGLQVSALPYDSVICAGLEENGVEVLDASFADARERLRGRRFDVLVWFDVLQFLDDPTRALREHRDLLAAGGACVVSCSNMARVHMLSRRARGLAGETDPDRVRDFQSSGVQYVTRAGIARWLRGAGFEPDAWRRRFHRRGRTLSKWTLGVFDDWFAERFYVRAAPVPGD
jgi:SAM-dependent methyltransferase